MGHVPDIDLAVTFGLVDLVFGGFLLGFIVCCLGFWLLVMSVRCRRACRGRLGFIGVVRINFEPITLPENHVEFFRREGISGSVTAIVRQAGFEQEPAARALLEDRLLCGVA